MTNIVTIALDEELDVREMFGNLDSSLVIIKDALGVDIMQRDGELILRGDDSAKLEKARKVIREMMGIVSSGGKLDTQKMNYVITLADRGLSYQNADFDNDIICYTHTGKPLRPKTLGQRSYVASMRKRDITFGIGPAGTGKTYLAVAMAVTAFKKRQVEKIILARPAVEAGERLGFLPGDLQEKVDPYLRPLTDALYDVLGREATLRLKAKETIEIVPLAYMRGRTLDNAFVILDEAQNTTREQMKMFLTRMGFGSRMVITGDMTQIDLPGGKPSGLLEARRVLRDVKGIDFCYLRDVDVVRHHLVKEIVNAYDRDRKEHPENGEDRGPVGKRPGGGGR